MTAPAHRVAWLVVAGGVAGALHVGKLPPALPVLRDELAISLVQAGFLLSMVQFAGMLLGLAVGLGADRLGLKRSMVCGLVLTGLASAAGGFMQTASALLALRGLEGLGFLLTATPAPALLRRTVSAGRLAGVLGVWGTYMPLGTALALLVGPACIAWSGWPGWWWALSVVSLGMALALAGILPPDPVRGAVAGLWPRARRTLSARGPWLAALVFGLYSAQWIAVIGFLPSVYRDAGLPAHWAAAATALAAAVNMAGNFASGRLLSRGVPPRRLLLGGLLAMAVGATLAFSAWGPEGAPGAWLRFAAVLGFSAFGGLVPGTLFSVGVRVAPDESTVSATVGWMQQWSAIGQFAGPPLVAWIAALAGGWHWSWTVTAGCAVAAMGLVLWLDRVPGARGP